MDDLKDLVVFFESMINSKSETVLFLDDELISEPLLYARYIDDENVRFLIADHKGCEAGLDICSYTIRCDVIVNKKKLLIEFYRAIKNIIRTCTIYEPQRISGIFYENWKDNLRNIVSFIRK